ARLGRARQGKGNTPAAIVKSHCGTTARPGWVRRGAAWRGAARQGNTRQGQYPRSDCERSLRDHRTAWQGVAWQGQAWLGKARQGIFQEIHGREARLKYWVGSVFLNDTDVK
ncbi:hypothetical protein LCGC14_1281330, partial [marine sediment metagenome]